MGGGFHAGRLGDHVDFFGNLLGRGACRIVQFKGTCAACDGQFAGRDGRNAACAASLRPYCAGFVGAEHEVAGAASRVCHAPADTVVAVRVGGEVRRRCGDGLVGVGADLEDGRGEGTIEHLATVKFRRAGDAVQFGSQRVDFVVERLTVAGAVRGVGRLHSQHADALQNVGRGFQRAFGGLRQRDTVVGVAPGLVRADDLCAEAFGNGQTGGVVLGAVDAQTGREALKGNGQCATSPTQVALRVQGGDVGVDDLCLRHFVLLLKRGLITPANGALLCCLPIRGTLPSSMQEACQFYKIIVINALCAKCGIFPLCRPAAEGGKCGKFCLPPCRCRWQNA